MRTTFFTKFSQFLITVAILMVCFFWITLLLPFQPVELIDDPMPVKYSQVRAGESQYIYLHFQKKMNIAPSMQWYLVDDVIEKLSQTGVTQPVGVVDVVRQIHIPVETAPNTYYLQLDLDYQILPWRSVKYSWRSQKFTVLASDSAKIR
jgi:hypothetical protein